MSYAVAGLTQIPAYNFAPQNFKRWRKALARVRSGSGYADIACYGDSTTWGFNSGAANPMTGGYPRVLQATMNTYLAPTVEGWMWPMAFTGSQPDTRWTLGTGWSYATGQGPGDGMGIDGASAATGGLALVPGFVFDSFQIAYAQNPSKGTSGAINVDGGASLGTIAATGVNTFKISPTYSVTRATHTINIGGPTGGDFYVLGIRAWDSTASSVRVSNGGVPGSKTAAWVDTTYPFSSLPVAFAGVTPDLAIINLTINDSTQGTAVATWQSNITTLVTTAQTNGADVILVAGVPSNPAAYTGITATQQSWAEILRQLAIQNNCGMVDFVNRWTDYPTSNTLGLYAAGDNLHPNSLGYADCAGAVFAALRSM